MSEPQQTVYLVRHGETEWSRDGRHTGRTEVPLTPTGRRQAQATGAALAGHAFAAVLVSPLGRARETAELAGLGDAAQVRDDLAEWDYGSTEGRTTAQMREEHPGWLLWSDGVTDGETVEQVGERVDRVIAEVRAIDGDVCVVAHGHLNRILGARWIELPPVGGSHLVLVTASISLLGHEHGIPALLRWNDTSHLAGDSTP